jgi:hypothetical protein
VKDITFTKHLGEDPGKLLKFLHDKFIKFRKYNWNVNDVFEFEIYRKHMCYINNDLDSWHDQRKILSRWNNTIKFDAETDLNGGKYINLANAMVVYVGVKHLLKLMIIKYV